MNAIMHIYNDLGRLTERGLVRRDRRRLLVATALSVAILGCSGTPLNGVGGPGFQINVAPLTLSDVTDAEYNLRVYNSDSVFDPTTLVWSQDGVTSIRYGDAKGAISYVGPCDADVTTDNTVELITVSFTGDGDFQLPCPAASPCRISRHCTENSDTSVVFNLTVMRNASQGFFDIAVNFEDIFCSAKVDCLSGGLLHDATGARKATVVAGLACTGGPGADGSVLLFDDLVMTCANPALTKTISTEPTAGLGNQMNPALDAAGAGVSVYQVGIYQGAERLDCSFDTSGNPISCQKIYSNTSIGIGAAAFGTTCTLTGHATAGSGDFASPTPNDTAYPIISINVKLTDGSGAGLTCGANPLNHGTPPDGSTPGTGCYAVPPTGVCTGYTALGPQGGVAFAHRYASAPVASAGSYCGDGVRDATEQCDLSPGCLDCSCDIATGFIFNGSQGCSCDTTAGFVDNGNGGCSCNLGMGYTASEGGGCVCDASAGFTPLGDGGDGGGCGCDFAAGFVDNGNGGCSCNIGAGYTVGQGGACVCDTSMGFAPNRGGEGGDDQGCSCDTTAGFVDNGNGGCSCNIGMGYTASEGGGCVCDASAGFRPLGDGGDGLGCGCDFAAGYASNGTGGCSCNIGAGYTVGQGGACVCDTSMGFATNLGGEDENDYGCSCDTTAGFVDNGDGGCSCNIGMGYTASEGGGCVCDASAGFTPLGGDSGGGCGCDTAAGYESDGNGGCTR